MCYIIYYCFTKFLHFVWFTIILLDSSILCEHQIVEGSKLHLSVRKPGDGAASAEDPNEFFAQLRDLLKQHFSAQDTEKVMAKFKEVW